MNIFDIMMLAPVVPFEDSTEILALVIATGLLMCIGIFSKYRIFLIFAVGGLIEFIVIWSEYTALVIVLIGMIIWSLWFATIGSRIE